MQTPTAKVGVAAAFDATPEELGAAAVKAARRGRIVEHIAHASSHVDVDVLLSDEAWR